MIYLGIDVASVNAAVATSSGQARKVQPPGAKKKVGTRWLRTDAMAHDIVHASQELAHAPAAYAVALEDIRFAGGGRYDDAGELRGILKWWFTASARTTAVLAVQPQQWRSVMSVASGLPEKVRYEVYRERALALGFDVLEHPELTNAKAREDGVSAFLLAKVCEWVYQTRVGNPPRADLISFPINAEALVALSRDPEVWLK